MVPRSTRIAQLPDQFALGVSSPAGWVVALVAVLIGAGALLAIIRGDPNERRGALIAATVGVAILAVPIVLAVSGSDYVITRNLISAWLPLTVVVATGFGARRAGLLGPLGAGVLAVLFAGTFLASEGRTALQRPTWRAVAQDLPPSANGRVVLLPSGSFTAIGSPLQLYLPHSHEMDAFATVDEVDVVGRPDPAYYVRDAAADYAPALLACWWGAACSVRSARLAEHSPAPTFALTARARAGLFTVLRFHSARTVRLAREPLGAFARTNRLSPTLILQQEAR
jgi:MFS family permease